MVELLPIPEGCIRIWEVWVNSDSTEGRGPMVLHARFLDHDEAVAEAIGKGPMGCSDGEVRQAVAFKNRQQFLKHRDEDLRQRVLKRLSAEERRVLGL